MIRLKCRWKVDQCSLRFYIRQLLAVKLRLFICDYGMPNFNRNLQWIQLDTL